MLGAFGFRDRLRDLLGLLTRESDDVVSRANELLRDTKPKAAARTGDENVAHGLGDRGFSHRDLTLPPHEFTGRSHVERRYDAD